MAFFRLGEAADALTARIARKRSLTRSVIAVERLWLLVLPALCLISLFFTLAWFGYFRMVPDWLRLVTLALFAVAGLFSLFLLSRFRLPSRESAERRLEHENAIAHQALAVQSDQPAGGDALGHALWQEHQRRMARRISNLGVGPPNPDTPLRDPYAVRAAIALLLVIAFSYSWSTGAGRPGDAFVPRAVSNAPAIRIDAWVTPPAYTGRAPIFLTSMPDDGERRIAVPEGSEIVVRVSGGAGQEEVAYRPEGMDAVRPLSAKASEAKAPSGTHSVPEATADARSYVMKATESGALEVAGAREGDRNWSFDVIADEAPRIAFSADPRRAVNGALEITFTAGDDYGVTVAEAIITPVAPADADARPLYGAPDYKLDIPRDEARDAEATASRDLTDHPFAGSEVDITLIARDASGQTARSEPRRMVLSERGFSEPLARAVVEQRRLLALDANSVPRVLALNDAITTAPEETFDDLSHFLMIKSARSRIANAYDDEALRSAADYLWDIALGIENGDLSLAERRLRDAQRTLAEALENEDATQEEIQALMDELRQAMQEYMQALAEELQNSDQAMEMPEGAMENLLTQEDLNDILDQIQTLAEQGAREEAQQMLSELQRMMNNLQTARRQPQGESPMRQQMDELGELMREQQELMNETFRLDQELTERMMRENMPQMPGQPGQPGQQQQDQQPGQNGEDQDGQQSGEMTREQLEEALRALRERQEALQERLGALQEQLEGMGMEPNEGFGSAGKSMGDAARSLGQGRGEQATGEQGQALEALRQGAQSMMDQMMQQMGEGEGQGETPGPGQQRFGRSQTDPLGRPRSNTGPDFGDDVEVPDQMDIQRAREILDAIRKRLGNALSPEMEQRYLERLLDLN